MYKIVYTKNAYRDVEKIKQSHLANKVSALLKIISKNPFQTPPPYEKLVGNLQGMYSRRVNIKHRLVYQVIEEEKVVKILSMWTHYEF